MISGQSESAWKRAIREYEEQGKSAKEAFSLAVADRARELSLSMLGGAFSGAVMAGSAVGLDYTTDTAIGKNLARKNGGVRAAMDNELRRGMRFSPDSDAYRMAQRNRSRVEKNDFTPRQEIRAAGRQYRVNKIQLQEDAKNIFDQMEQAQKELDDTMSSVAEELGLSYENGTQKSIESMTGKVLRHDGEYGLLDMKDHARTHLELKSWDQIPEVLDALRKRNIPFTVEAKETTATGYKGLHITWKNANGLGCEVQLTTPDAWRVKLATDEAYQKWRNRGPREAKKENKRFLAGRGRSRELFDALDLPDFSIYESTSASDNSLPLSNSPKSSPFAGTQEPLTRASGRPPVSSGESSMMRPDSVSMNIESSPLQDSMPQEEGNVNTKNPEILPLPAPGMENNATGKVTGRQDVLALGAYGTNDPVKQARWRQAEKIAKVFGAELRAAAPENGADASYLNGVIRIDPNVADPVQTLLLHELTHHMERKTGYDRYAAAVVDYLREKNGEKWIAGMEREIRADYRKRGEELDDAGVRKELVAKYSEMLQDETFAKRLAREDPNVVQRIIDWCTDQIAKLGAELRGDKEAAFLVDMRRMYENALRSAQSGKTSGTEQYSIKRTSQMSLKDQMKEYNDGKMRSSDAFYFGVTPATLSKSGFAQIPLVFTISDFKKSTIRKHGTKWKIIKEVPEKLKRPILSFEADGKAGILLDAVDNLGRPVLVAIHSGEVMDNQEVNAIHSIYGLDHPKEWAKNQLKGNKKLVVYDEERADAFLRSVDYEALQGESTYSLQENLSQNDEKNNPQNAAGRNFRQLSDDVFDELTRSEPPEAEDRSVMERLRQKDLDEYWEEVERLADAIADEDGTGADPDDIVQTEVQQEKVPLREKIEDVRSFIVRKFFDAGDAVTQIQKQTGDRYLYSYFNQARASANSAVQMIEGNRFDVLGRNTGDGFRR